MDDPVPLALHQADLYRVAFSVVLLVLSGFVSGSEVAFFSIRSAELDAEKYGRGNLQRLHLLLENPPLLLAALLTLNTFINITLVVVSDPFFNRHFSEESGALRLIFQVGVVSLVILIFGELIPKIFARRHPATLAAFACRIFYPVIRYGKPLFQPLLLLSRLLGTNRMPQGVALTRTELSDAMEITGVAGQQSPESRILKGIIDFGDKEVSQIMTPRVHVAGADYDFSFGRLLDFIRLHGYSRVPVFRGTPDNVAGVLVIKDLIPHLRENEDFNWHRFIRQPFFVPENMTARRLLKEFQQKNYHIALVLDEHGGFSGVVTLEDIIEEVVGEIEDEHDEKTGPVQKLGEDLYIFDGATMIGDFLKICNLPDDYFTDLEADFDSLGGLVIEIAEKIPAAGEELQYKALRFKVLKADERRIISLKVRLERQNHSG